MIEEWVMRVEAVYVGDEPTSLKKAPREYIEIDMEGIVGDKHAGFTKLADVRDKGIEKGTVVRNWRQWSGLSVLEVAEIALNLGIESFDPACLGPNLLFSGIEGFSKLPKGTTFWFPDRPGLLVEAENLPCINPGQEIANGHPINPSDFVKAALDRRGLVGTIVHPGRIQVGDLAHVKLP